jgi:processive 1,2-diacylglycerol beta-glucosyltransferase
MAARRRESAHPGNQETSMIELRDKDTGAYLGAITEAQLNFMIDQLEEEDSEDTDYYINQATIEMFEQRQADPQLLDVLRKALLSRSDMEIRWSRA